jgi:hypothetical protein
VNVSRKGLLIEAGEPIEVGSAVDIESGDLGLNCSAIVRHCTRRRAKFLIGIEFSEPLMTPLFSRGLPVSAAMQS